MKEDLKFALGAIAVCGIFGATFNNDTLGLPQTIDEQEKTMLIVLNEENIEEPIVVEMAKPTKKTPNSNKRYKLSNQGKKFIKKMEQCSLTAYWDRGKYSIGYGHRSDDNYEGMTITQEQADAYFEEDVKWVENAVNRLLHNLPYDYEFSQNFVDSLCSFIYNCGENGAKNSTFYNRLSNCRVKDGIMNSTDYHFTIASIKTSKVSCKAHERRRKEEYKLMMNI